MSETTGETTVPVGALVPQGHGGALRNGGTNRGGPGRPKDRVKAAAVESLEKRLKVADEIIDDEEAKDRDRISGLAFLAKVGGMAKDAYDQALIDDLWEATEAALPDDLDVVARVREAWVPVLARKVLANT